MKVDTVLGATFFFIILRLVYMENTKKSLTKKEMTEMVQEKMGLFGITFKNNGDG
jgi:hypothetical protein